MLLRDYDPPSLESSPANSTSFTHASFWPIRKPSSLLATFPFLIELSLMALRSAAYTLLWLEPRRERGAS